VNVESANRSERSMRRSILGFRVMHMIRHGVKNQEVPAVAKPSSL
jgi:hypothetical protein